MSLQVQYQQLNSEAQPEEPDEYTEETETYFMRVTNRPGLRWPKVMGIIQIVLGMVITLLGILEVIVIPLSENHQACAQFNKNTCYGVGIYAGAVMVLTGSMAVRASVSKRLTTVYRFYNLTVLTLLVYSGLMLFLIVAYSKGWTSQDAYPPNSRMHEVHMFLTMFMALGLMFALAAVVQYYDVVCCGELKLWQWWTNCLCFACLDKVKNDP